MNAKPHVWIVSLPRCGTTSLSKALRILGWNPIDNPRHWDQLEGHDAAGDVLIATHWRDLLEMFPRSKFILSTRRFSAWRRSLLRIPGFWTSPMIYDQYHRNTLFGCSPTDRAGLRTAWDWHHDTIVNTIPPAQLLCVPLASDWEPLCQFLDRPIPAVPFPWLNRLGHQDVPIRGG
jgi:hypothetical protein